jgi:hypothetical protein
LSGSTSDHALLEKLGALIDVRHPRHGQLERRLDQAVVNPAGPKARLEPLEVRPKGFPAFALEREGHEGGDLLLIFFIGVGPIGAQPRFPQRFAHRPDHPVLEVA